MPSKGKFRVLNAIEIAKLVADETGLTEREALRIFRSVFKVLRSLLLSGYGATLGHEMTLEPKPVKKLRYRHPAEGDIRIKRPYWIAKLRVSAAFQKLMTDTLEEPSDEEFRQYERAHNRYGDKLW